MAAPGAKAEEIELRKAIPEAWEGAPLMWRTATLRPKIGVDGVEAEDTELPTLNGPR